MAEKIVLPKILCYQVEGHLKFDFYFNNHLFERKKKETEIFPNEPKML